MKKTYSFIELGLRGLVKHEHDCVCQQTACNSLNISGTNLRDGEDCIDKIIIAVEGVSLVCEHCPGTVRLWLNIEWLYVRLFPIELNFDNVYSTYYIHASTIINTFVPSSSESK